VFLAKLAQRAQQRFKLVHSTFSPLAKVHVPLLLSIFWSIVMKRLHTGGVALLVRLLCEPGGFCTTRESDSEEGKF